MAPKNPYTGQKVPTSGIWQPTNGGKQIAVSKGASSRLRRAKAPATSPSDKKSISLGQLVLAIRTTPGLMTAERYRPGGWARRFKR